MHLRVTTFLLVFLILLIFFLASYAHAGGRQFILKDVKSYGTEEGSSFFVLDFDNDGDDDLLYDRLGSGLLCLRIDNLSFYPIVDNGYYAYGKALGIFDVDDDGFMEFFILVHPEDSFYVACYDWFSPHGSSSPKYVIGPFLAEQPKLGGWAKGCIVINCFDGDGDSRKELYIGVNNYYPGPVPRSLICFDALTGKRKWEFQLGQLINEVFPFVVDGGERRIVVSTFAPNNGAFWGGTGDDVSYLYCLSPSGDPIWKEETGGVHSWVHMVPCDVDSDGFDEIVAARLITSRSRVEQQRWGYWTAAIISPENGEIIKTINVGDGSHVIYGYNLDGDERPEVFIITQDNRLVLLNSDFTIRWIKDEKLYHSVYAVADLNNDGSKEIICRMADSLVVLDGEGNRLAAKPVRFPGKACVRTGNIGGKNYLFVNDNNVIKVIALERASVIGGVYKWQKHYSYIFIIGVLIGSLVSTFVLMKFGKGKRATINDSLDIKYREYDDLLLSLVSFGHGGSLTKVMDRIKLYLKNWGRFNGDGEALEKLKLLGETYSNSIVPELKKISGISKRCGLPPEIYKSLDAASAGVSKAMETVFSPGIEDATNYVGDALENLEVVDKTINAIKKHLRTIFCVNATSCCNEVFSGWEEEFEKRGIKATLKKLGSQNDRVFIHPMTFKRIVDGLIDNAVRAVEGVESREVGITIGFEGSYCVIDVEDNGCGVPEENWENIFERHFTTKEEGGFGLYYAREELAKFSGKIFVKFSKVGVGTIIRMVLRRC